MKIRRVAMLAALTSSVWIVGTSVAPPAHAGPGAPAQCIVDDFPSKVVAAVPLPNCSDIEGLCIVFEDTPIGPARAVHAGRVMPAGGAVVDPPDDCVSFPRECRIFVSLPPDGPTRAAHASARTVPSGGGGLIHPGDIFNVDPICVELPGTGFDVAPALLAGLVVLGIGIAVLESRRIRPLRS